MTDESAATLLIVDDDTSSRTILKSIFSGRYNLIEAANGSQTLDYLHRGKLPDLVILDLNMPDVDGFDVLAEIQNDPAYHHIPFIVITADNASQTRNKALSLGAVEILTKPYHPDSILLRVNNILSSIDAAKNKVAEQIKNELSAPPVPSDGSAWGKAEFSDAVSRYLRLHPDENFILARWDIAHFKLFNETFGMEAGDTLLRSIDDRFAEAVNKSGNHGPVFYVRWEADHFVSLWNEEGFNPDKLYRFTLQQVESCFTGFDFSIKYGFYKITDPSLAVATMCDRANLALRAAKQKYDVHFIWYDDSMRSRIVEEQELASSMKHALRCGEFIAYYQPQYNYDSGELIGAEALVRWKSPEKGLISPGSFIPLFEKNGFITEVDLYIWEEVCKQIRQWIDAGLQPPPISVNMSRRDLYEPNLVAKIQNIIEKYNLTADRLHIEITESAYMDNPEQLLEVVEKLQSLGFHIEMDDFGSGYSSLNTLKDVAVDMLKLDMKFVAESANNSRGGSILSSVVHMAHAINLPVIAEGVETKQQADYLKTVNCLYMQGYYFSKPLPEADFTEILALKGKGPVREKLFQNVVDNTVDFLDGSTQATLLFNSFIGGAGIIEYENKLVNILRLNDRFFEEICIPRQVFCKSDVNIIHYFDDQSKINVINTIDKAILTNSEAFCEVCFVPESDGFDRQWIEVRFRYLAKKFSSQILYFTVTNKTNDKILQQALTESKKRTDEILRFVPGGLAEFVVKDKAFIRKYISESAAAILGYENLNAKQVNILAHATAKVNPDDKKLVTKIIKNAIAHKKPFSADARIIAPNGAVRWVNLTANPIESSTELRYYGIYTDITRQKALEMLQETESDDRTIVTSDKGGIMLGAWKSYCATTPDYVSIKDLNSNYLCCSDKFAQYCGLKNASDIIGLSDFDIAESPAEANRYIQTDLQVISSGKPLENIMEAIVGPDGETHLFSNSKYPILNPDGQIIGVLGVARDVTNAHLLEEYKLALGSSGKHIYRYTVKDRAFHDIEEIDGVIAPISFVGAPEQVVEQGIIVKGQEAKWLGLFKQIDDGERFGVTDIRFVEKNGEYCWYRVSFKSVFDEKGMPSSAIISYKNVDGYHTLERDKTMERNCIFAAMTALYPIYIASNLSQNRSHAFTQNDDSVINENTVFETYDEAIEAYAKFIHPDEISMYYETFSRESLLKRFSKSSEHFSAIFTHLCKDGVYRHTETVMVPTIDLETGDLLCVGLMKLID